MSKQNQGSLEYIILIGGVIILAAASYFMLRGFAQTTKGDSLENIGRTSEKFRLELENLGRSELSFSSTKWAGTSAVSSFIIENSGATTSSEITIGNITDYGINITDVVIAYNTSSGIVIIEYTLDGDDIVFTPPTLLNGTVPTPFEFEILIFHENTSALKIDNLNYTAEDPDITVDETGSSPVESPDTTPPSVTIATGGVSSTT